MRCSPAFHDHAELDAASLLSAPPPARRHLALVCAGGICGSVLELHMALFSLASPCTFSKRSLCLTCSDRCTSQKRASFRDEEEPLSFAVSSLVRHLFSSKKHRKVPPSILKQSIRIASTKNSAAMHHRVPHLFYEWLTQVTSWLALGKGSRPTVAAYQVRSARSSARRAYSLQCG